MRDQPQALMLFAAGFGTRMGALTQDRPKPLVKVAGRALIDHAWDLVAPLDLPRVVANLHYMPDMLADHLKDRGIALSYELPDILETGGGLRAALPLLGPGPVFTLNTDAIWSGPNPLEILRAAWDPSKMDALLLCLPPERALEHRGKGDFVPDAQGRATRGPGVIYGGAQILKPEGLAGIEEQAFSLNVLWDEMLARKRLFVVEYPGRWCDVGRPEGIQAAETLLSSA